MGQNSSTLSSSDNVNFFYLITSVYPKLLFHFLHFLLKRPLHPQVNWGISPSTPMSDQDGISPYNINTIINQISDKNKENYEFGDN